MTLWIAWSVLTSALLAAAAVALERAAFHLGAPRRFIWMAAMLAATAAPFALAARRAPVEQPASPRDGTLSPAAVLSAAIPAHTRATTMSVLQTPPREGPSRTVAQQADRLERKWIRALAGWPNLANRADPWLVVGWLLASVVLLLLFLRDVARLRRRQSEWSSVATDAGVVFVSRNVGPAVVGFLHPRIVVPSWTLSANSTTRALLLQHELEHIRAGDTRALLASELALILVPWNAALWCMTRRLRLAIELDCDARVVRAIGEAHAYGVALLAVGEQYAAGLPLATSFSGSRLNLEVRIDAMTAPRKRHPIAASLPLVTITLGVLATAAWMPRPTPLVPARTVAPVVAPTAQPRTVGVYDSITRDPASVAAHERVVRPDASTPAPPREPRPLRGNRAPRYPETMRVTGTDGYVILGFSVDARGNPDSATIHIFSATDSSFTDAVRAVVPSWHFDSAGSVRIAVRFLTSVTEAAERSGDRTAPVLTVNGEPLTLAPVVVTTLFEGASLAARPEGQHAQEPHVSVSYANAPIIDVLNAFAQYSHRNIVASKSVRGTVTGVVQDQPWRSALRSLLNANGYDFAVDADSSLVVDTIGAIQNGRNARDTTLADVGYAARKQAGAGFFIDGNQLDRQASAFSQMLRNVPGLNVTASGCVNFFVDGSWWQTLNPGDIDTAVSPAQVVAMEVYATSPPPRQFAAQNPNQCAATVVIWTRARVRPD